MSRKTDAELEAKLRQARQTRLDAIHTTGAKRHPQQWYVANQAAVRALWACNYSTSKLENKLLAATMVLRVLDAVQDLK